MKVIIDEVVILNFLMICAVTYHQVHIFDPSTPQRRPVLEVEFGEYPLTTLSLPAAGDTVVVGNTHGQIALLDLRKGVVRGCFKGMSGAVRELKCHPSLPIMASCGLDRFLCIHSLDDRKLQHKVYLKSRLNCLLFTSRELQDDNQTAVREEESTEVKEEKGGSDDEVWDHMEHVVEEEVPSKKMKRA